MKKNKIAIDGLKELDVKEKAFKKVAREKGKRNEIKKCKEI